MKDKNTFNLLLLFWKEKLAKNADIEKDIISKNKIRFILGVFGGIPLGVHPLIIKEMLIRKIITRTCSGKTKRGVIQYKIEGDPNQFSKENLNDYYEAIGLWDGLKEKEEEKVKSIQN